MREWIKLFRMVYYLETGGEDIGLKLAKDAYWRCRGIPYYAEDPMQTLEVYRERLRKHGLIQ